MPRLRELRFFRRLDDKYLEEEPAVSYPRRLEVARVEIFTDLGLLSKKAGIGERQVSKKSAVSPLEAAVWILVNRFCVYDTAILTESTMLIA